MRATHVIAAMAGIIAAALVAMLVDAGLARSDQPPIAVREVNVDPGGNIKVHEQGIPIVRVSSPESDPVLVGNVDSPRHPFQRELDFGEAGCQDVAVPDAQQLIIEYVSAKLGATENISPELSLTTRASGVPAIHYVPVATVPHSDSTQFVAGEDVRIYADAGTNVHVCASVASAFISATGIVGISGHVAGPAPSRGP